MKDTTKELLGGFLILGWVGAFFVPTAVIVAKSGCPWILLLPLACPLTYFVVRIGWFTVGDIRETLRGSPSELPEE